MKLQPFLSPAIYKTTRQHLNSSPLASLHPISREFSHTYRTKSAPSFVVMKNPGDVTEPVIDLRGQGASGYTIECAPAPPINTMQQQQRRRHLSIYAPTGYKYVFYPP